MELDRRELLTRSLSAAWLLGSTSELLADGHADRKGAAGRPSGHAGAVRKTRPLAHAANLPRWCPRFPIARELWMLPFAGDVEEGMLLESAAGLAARAALNGPWRALLYEELDNDGYRRWFDAYCRAHRPTLRRMDLDEAVDRLHRAGIARGFLLYRFDRSDRPLHSPGPLDESANVATALAASAGGLAVSERLAPRMEGRGLTRLLDARDVTEAACLRDHADRFSTQALGTADPKTRNVRSVMIALGTFVCAARGDTYTRALARCAPDSPIIGWGCEAEDAQTIPSSRHGLYQTATNWCHNLPVFAGETLPPDRLRARHTRHWSDLDWGDGRHHASFVLTDGDNVQWLMGNFTGGTEAHSYYANPDRGRIPFGWGLPASSLAQLSPRTLEEVLARATHNDDFLLYSGGGYFYPDLYGQARHDSAAIARHGDRLRAYMDLTNIRVLAYNFQDWDSRAALDACAALAARMPGLLGILAFQYYPYSAGEGAIRWVPGAGGDQVPVVSCRLCLWAQTGRPRDTTPAGVAAWLNRLPVAAGAATDDAFSFVLAHAWSRFRRVDAGAPPDAEERDVPQDRDTPGTARGYSPVLWAAERLAPTVRPVTPSELCWRIRLRLRPHDTLARFLREARTHLSVGASQHLAPSLMARAEALLPHAATDPDAARRCFELLKEGY